MVAFNKKTVADLDWPAGIRAFVRVDYDLALDHSGQIVDDLKIRRSLPTLKYLLNQSASVIVGSHLGQADGQAWPNLSLAPVVYRLRQLLPGVTVKLVDDWLNLSPELSARGPKPGQIWLLENLAFHQAELSNQAGFARNLSHLADILVIDSLAGADKSLASTVGLAKLKPAVAGLALEAEIRALAGWRLSALSQPLALVIGDDQLLIQTGLARKLLARANFVAISGPLVVNFLAALGVRIAADLTRPKLVEQASRLLVEARVLANQRPFELFIGRDYQVAPAQAVKTGSTPTQRLWQLTGFNKSQVLATGDLLTELGPESIGYITGNCRQAGSVIIAGPIQLAESGQFPRTGQLICRTLAGRFRPKTLITHPEILAGLSQSEPDLIETLDHISTGGHLALAVLAQQKLPGLNCLIGRSKPVQLSAGPK